MSEVKFVSDMDVELIDSMGSDKSVVRAARVSTGYVLDADGEMSEKDGGLINYLMRERHGSPFEHTALTFRIQAPIFVFREFHRHRAGWSYNEVSGRYSKLEPVFYVPNIERPLLNVGTAARPELEHDTADLYSDLAYHLCGNSEDAWYRYDQLLANGVANEVARMALPVNVVATMYATCNARSLMHFLSLRTRDERAAHVSRPQLEIEMVARKMEAEFERLLPVTHAAFNKHGRVSP